MLIAHTPTRTVDCSTTTRCARLTFTSDAGDIDDRRLLDEQARIQVRGHRAAVFTFLAILMGVGVALVGPMAAIVPLIIDGAHQTTAIFEFAEAHR